MSRSNYNEDCCGWDLIRWRGAVASAIKGSRGQKLLREMAAAMDAMPVKRLIGWALEANGEVCALGSVGRVRGVAMDTLDPEDPERIAQVFQVAPALIQEVAFMNDEWSISETPEQRWQRMRQWIGDQIANNGNQTHE